MQIKFQANYYIQGSSPDAINSKIEELDKQAKVGVASQVASQNCRGNSCSTDERAKPYAAALLTDNEAVAFLKNQGITVTLPSDREAVDEEITRQLPTDNDARTKLVEELFIESHRLRFQDTVVTDIDVDEDPPTAE